MHKWTRGKSEPGGVCLLRSTVVQNEVKLGHVTLTLTGTPVMVMVMVMTVDPSNLLTVSDLAPIPPL